MAKSQEMKLIKLQELNILKLQEMQLIKLQKMKDFESQEMQHGQQKTKQESTRRIRNSRQPIRGGHARINEQESSRVDGSARGSDKFLHGA